MEKFCTGCGARLGDNEKFCGKCGKAVEGEVNEISGSWKKICAVMKRQNNGIEDRGFGVLPKEMALNLERVADYILMIAAMFLPWLLLSQSSDYVTYSITATYGMLLEDLDEDKCGFLIAVTFIFILLSGVLFFLKLVKWSNICIIVAYLPKLYLLFKIFTEVSGYRSIPHIGMIFDIVAVISVCLYETRLKRIRQNAN